MSKTITVDQMIKTLEKMKSRNICGGDYPIVVNWYGAKSKIVSVDLFEIMSDNLDGDVAFKKEVVIIHEKAERSNFLL